MSAAAADRVLCLPGDAGGRRVPLPEPLLVRREAHRRASQGRECKECFADSYCITGSKCSTQDPANPEVNLPNKIRLMWGRMENFKCVDYFQIEYYEKDDRVGDISVKSTQY